LLAGCFKAGDFERAMRVWEQLVKDPGASLNHATYKVMLDGLSKLGRFKEVGQVWNRMVVNNHQPDTTPHGLLIHGLCRSGDVDGAARVSSEMVKAGLVLNVAIYNSLIKGCCQGGKVGEAWKFWGLLDSGMVDEATELLVQLENEASSSPDKVGIALLIRLV
jgi:pentatricopeptide repeat protein